MYSYYLTIVLAPLFAAIVAGLFGHKIGRKGAHSITIGGVGLSCLLSFYVLYRMYWGGAEPENISVYTWAVTDGLRMEVGFLVDRLTVLMMSVVTFVSLMVHVYTIGYMHDDPGYQRFFSYISLFTFSMLMLVMSNNFLQLFFGWEAVGLVSYLLIGFWFKRETAIFANLKAFLVNRVGDFGFILGIAAIVTFTGSLDYATVFGQAEEVEERICLEFDDEFAPLVELERPVIRCLTVLRLARDVRGHELGYLTHGKRAVRVSIRRFLFSGATLHRPAEALQQPSRE